MGEAWGAGYVVGNDDAKTLIDTKDTIAAGSKNVKASDVERLTRIANEVEPRPKAKKKATKKTPAAGA